LGRSRFKRWSILIGWDRHIIFWIELASRSYELSAAPSLIPNNKVVGSSSSKLSWWRISSTFIIFGDSFLKPLLLRTLIKLLILVELRVLRDKELKIVDRFLANWGLFFRWELDDFLLADFPSGNLTNPVVTRFSGDREDILVLATELNLASALLIFAVAVQGAGLLFGVELIWLDWCWVLLDADFLNDISFNWLLLAGRWIGYNLCCRFFRRLNCRCYRLFWFWFNFNFRNKLFDNWLMFLRSFNLFRLFFFFRRDF